MTINLSDEMINTLLDAIYEAKKNFHMLDEQWSKLDEAEEMLRQMLVA